MTDIRAVLKDAEKKGASDVHICVGASIRYRIHGTLQDTGLPVNTASDTLAILLSLIDQEQRERFEKKGEIDIGVCVGEGRYRVNAFKQRGNITIVIRIFDTVLPDAGELLIPEQVLNLCRLQKGLVIISGPSGSGKSTILATLLDRINSERSCSIITLEDPIEYLHTHKLSIVNQREIGIDSSSYEDGLKSAIREDPDVIFLSRTADKKSILLMLRAVEMGKLVFTASYTPSTVEAVDSMVSYFSRDEEAMIRGRLSACLEGVVSRQLLRSLDGTRKPVYEILLCEKNVREAIKKGDDTELENLIKKGHDKGMYLMDESILGLFLKGALSESSAVKNANDPDRMKLALAAYSSKQK